VVGKKPKPKKDKVKVKDLDTRKNPMGGAPKKSPMATN
jgi:hypothetical protein